MSKLGLKPRPMITWVDDDGHIGFLEKLVPLAKEYEIPITCAMVTNMFGKTGASGIRYMTKEEARQAHEAGCEIVSHTHYHSLSNLPIDMTDEQLLEDYKTSQNIIKELGFNWRGFVHPFGNYTQREIDFAKKVYDYAVGTSTRGDHIVIPPVDRYNLLRTNAQGRFDAVKAQIHRAIEHNGWLLLTTHVDQGGWWSEEYARKLIEYALSQGIEFVTTEEGMEQLGSS